MKLRGQELRGLPFSELQALKDRPTERLTVGTRTATINVIVLRPLYPREDTVQVVVQGFLKHRIFPCMKAAMDGFYKHPDGTVSPMADRDFWDFD